jgi:predicted MFS family arabinose efflux permease
VIAVGLVIWSVATAASGFADDFWTLFAARFMTGIGEASLYPCSLSLLAERFPADRRGRALGVFAAAAAIGAGLGVGLGGSLSQTLGWRRVFFIYGAAGICCLPLLLSVPEARRAQIAARAEPTRDTLQALLADRRLLWVWACGAVAMASGQGFAAWVPSYFVRALSMEVKEAGALFGVAALAGGIFGGVLGGTLFDRFRKLGAGREFVVPACAAFTAAALALGTIEAGSLARSSAGSLLATMAIFAIFPGLISSVLSFVAPHRHGMAGALNTLFFGGIGAATGPFVVGAASDAFASLHAALYIPAAGLVLAGVLALGARSAVRGRRGLPAAAAM